MKLIAFSLIILAAAQAQRIPSQTIAQSGLLYGPFQEEPPISCSEEYVDEPPFHVSSAYKQGDRTFENFRSQDNYREKAAYIPRRSIVKIPKESQEYANHPNYYVPVEVVGVNETDHHEKNLDTRGKFGWASALRTGMERVKTGQKGFIHAQSLERADKYTYVVKEDSPIIKDNGLEDMGVVALKPVMANGQFLAQKCCSEAEFDPNRPKILAPKEKCFLKHQFKIISSKSQENARISLDAASCAVANTLAPFENDSKGDITAMLNFLKLASGESQVGFNLDKLETLDSRGLVKVPLDYESFDGNGMNGPFGSYHYNSDNRGAQDVYAKPYSACAFMEVLKNHQKRCQGYGCQTQFGNLYHPKSWGAHETHGDGECIDVRPLRVDNTQYSLTHQNPIYDREKTRELIELFKEAGATTIIFNDPQIQRNDPAVARYPGHDNHIHLCLPADSAKVQATCRDGLD